MLAPLKRLAFSALLLSVPSVGLGATYFVRGSACSNGDGLNYLSAWCGSGNVDWSLIDPGDTLYLCGSFTAPVTVPHQAAHGTSRKPITVSGACPRSFLGTDPGELHMPTGSATFAFRLMRRDNYRIEHLLIREGGMLILDSANTTLFNVEIRDTPKPPPGSTVQAAIMDRGLSTTYDTVRIINPGEHGIDQSDRGHNPYLPSPGLLASNVTFLTKPDFQQLSTKTVIKNSYFEGGGLNENLERLSTVKLLWNDEVLIENTSFINVGSSAIELSTADGYARYPLQKGGSPRPPCNTYCTSVPGWSCNASDQCVHLASDPSPALDAYEQGASPPLSPTINVRGNVLSNDAPQCETGVGLSCDPAPCPFGYSCEAGTCKPNESRCADSHYGIVVPPGPPIKGSLTLNDNSISGFMGNGILLETRWEGPAIPVTIRDNWIHNNSTWGIWLSNSSQQSGSGQLLLSGNRIENNGADLARLNLGGGVQINGATSNVLLQNNFLVENGRSGANTKAKFGGLVIAQACFKLDQNIPCSTLGLLTSPSDITVARNTFVNNNTANIMTHYEVASGGAVLGIRNLRVEHNINLQNRLFQKHAPVSWRNFASLAAQGPLASVDEFSYLDNNLYFTGTSPFSLSRFYILRTPYHGLAAYQLAISRDEQASIHLDPQLDANHIPKARGAAAYGAR